MIDRSPRILEIERLLALGPYFPVTSGRLTRLDILAIEDRLARTVAAREDLNDRLNGALLENNTWAASHYKNLLEKVNRRIQEYMEQLPSIPC